MRVCVFSGSNLGFHPRYLAAARRLGRGLARRGIDLVYGGASVGLMSAVADAALEAGGTVTGVVTPALVDEEIAHQHLGDQRMVTSTHERRALMAELADAFVALPGGLGTLEHLFEAWSSAQLGHHAKPCALYNVDGYFDRLLDFLGVAAMEGFLKLPHREMLIVADTVEVIVERFANYTAPAPGKWLARPLPPATTRRTSDPAGTTAHRSTSHAA